MHAELMFPEDTTSNEMFRERNTLRIWNRTAAPCLLFGKSGPHSELWCIYVPKNPKQDWIRSVFLKHTA